MKKNILFIICVLTFCTSCTIDQNNSSATNGTSYQDVVIENILTRRSIRQYQPTPIDSVQLRKIIECGLYAPNGKGLESWEVRVVSHPDILQSINLSYNENDSTLRHAFFEAPALIFIAYNTEYDLSQVDCGLLGGNMMLAAHSMGIGSCCLGGLARFVNSDKGESIREILEFSPTHRLLYAIAFGYPNESPKAKERHWDRVKFIE